MMSSQLSLDRLWQSVVPGDRPFQPDQLEHLPAAAQRYLCHEIAPGTPLATAVRLRMQGEIKLKGWCPFRAEQVIHCDRGMIWNATAWVNGLPISGGDRILDGQGAMRWKLLGLFPVVTADGADITRSGMGRLAAEYIWLPSLFCGDAIAWESSDPHQVHAHLTLPGETPDLHLTLNDQGGLQSIQLQRWGNPDGGEFGYVSFGGWIEREETFSGYTIPTQIRVGWYFGSDRFDSEGEFFRATVTQVRYR